MLVTVVSCSGSVAFGASIQDTFESKLKTYIAYVERENNIPSGLLLAIASVESCFKPYSLNIAGKTVFPRNYRDAVYVTKKAIKSGITNIDLGIMQINYRWHNKNFGNIDEMLHPKNNIKYAGQLISLLYKKHGDWHKAVKYYHSANSKHHTKYSRKVVLEWIKYN